MGHAISYIQNLSILNSFNLHISDAYDEVMKFISITTLNFDISSTWLPVRNDWRTQETLITTGVPLIIVVCVLLFYQPALNVIWYLLLLSSLTLTAGAAVVMVQKDFQAIASELLSINVVHYLLATGITVLVLCVIIALVVTVRKRRQKQGKATKRRLTRVTIALKRDTENVAWPSYLIKMGVLLAVLVLGLFVSRIFYSADTASSSSLGGLAQALGYSAFIAASVGILCMLLWLVPAVRRFWWRFTKLVNKHFLRLLLVVVHIMYLPVMQNTLQVFNCVEVTCAAGTRFPDDVPIYTSEVAVQCSPCTFYPNNATMAPLDSSHCSVAMQTALCPAETRLVLANNYSIQCTKIWYFFWPSSLIMLFAFGFGVPWLFWKLIKNTFEKLKFFPVTNAPDDEEAKWQMVLLHSDCCTRSFYEQYERPWRYWRLFDLMQKFMIVCITLFFTSPDVSLLGLMYVTGVHIMTCIVLVRFRPYVNNLEDSMMILLSFVMSLSYVVSVTIAADVLVPQNEWQRTLMTAFLFTINGVVILLSLLVTAVLFRNRKKVINDALKETQKAPENAADEATAGDAEAPPEVTYIAANSVRLLGSDLGHSGQSGVSALPPHLASIRMSASGRRDSAGSGSLKLGTDSARRDSGRRDSGRRDSAIKLGVNDEVITITSCYSDTSRSGPVERNVDDDVHRRPSAELRRRSSGFGEPGIPWAMPVQHDTRRPVVPRETPRNDSLTRSRVLEMVERQQEAVNFKVAEETERIMSSFFMISGILIFVSLAFCFAGILQHTFFGSFVPSRPFTNAAAVQLANYSGWEDFSAHCCCLGLEHDVEEKWLCANNRSLNRLRQENNVSGLAVRPFCGRAFDPQCSLLVASSDAQPTLSLNCTFDIHPAIQQLW